MKEARFKDKLLDFFKSTRKTGWNKNEVVQTIKDFWTDHLESMIIEEKTQRRIFEEGDE